MGTSLVAKSTSSAKIATVLARRCVVVWAWRGRAVSSVATLLHLHRRGPDHLALLLPPVCPEASPGSSLTHPQHTDLHTARRKACEHLRLRCGVQARRRGTQKSLGLPCLEMCAGGHRTGASPSAEPVMCHVPLPPRNRSCVMCPGRPSDKSDRPASRVPEKH